MLFRFPKDDKNFHWTSHIKNKMLFYRISEQKIRTILKSPDRREEGIAPNTSAVMKRNDTPKRKEEIWVMYRQNVGSGKLDDRGLMKKKSNSSHSTSTKVHPASNPPHPTNQTSRLILISSWRYPGKSKEGKAIPIPEDILSELGWKI